MAENHLYHAVGYDPAATINQTSTGRTHHTKAKETNENGLLGIIIKSVKTPLMWVNSDQEGTDKRDLPPAGVNEDDQRLPEFGGLR